MIRLRDSICKDCRLKHGNDPAKWPEWLSFLVNNEQKEINRQRRHDFDRFYNDELSYKKRKKIPVSKNEKDFEDMLWDNQ